MSLRTVSSYFFQQVNELSCGLKTVLLSNTCTILFSIQMLFDYRNKSPFLNIKKMSHAPKKKKKKILVKSASFNLFLQFKATSVSFCCQKSTFCPPVFDFLPLSLRLRLWLLFKLFCLSHVDLRRTVLLCSVKISSIFEQPPELIFSRSGRQWLCSKKEKN